MKRKPKQPPRAPQSLEERFWAKVDKTPGHGPNGDCWLWTGAVDSNGYGAVRHSAKRNTHRVAYELAHGSIDRNMDIMHSCDVRLCCNDAHLSAGTRLENVRDAHAKERTPRGESNGTSKLSEPLVRLIRELAQNGYARQRIARIAGLHRETVRNVVNGSTWAHVKPLTEEVAS